MLRRTTRPYIDTLIRPHLRNRAFPVAVDSQLHIRLTPEQLDFNWVLNDQVVWEGCRLRRLHGLGLCIENHELGEEHLRGLREDALKLVLEIEREHEMVRKQVAFDHDIVRKAKRVKEGLSITYRLENGKGVDLFAFEGVGLEIEQLEVLKNEWRMGDIQRAVGNFRRLKRKAVEKEFREKRKSRRICGEDVGVGWGLLDS